MVGLFFCFSVACSQPKKPASNAMLITHITAPGVKQFQYSVTDSSKEKKGGNQRPGGQGGGKGRGGMGNQDREKHNKRERGEHGKQKSADRMKKHIEEKLMKAGYCREGFMEIDHYSEAGRYHFNGQCNEKATDKDRKTFKNQ